MKRCIFKYLLGIAVVSIAGISIALADPKPAQPKESAEKVDQAVDKALSETPVPGAESGSQTGASEVSLDGSVTPADSVTGDASNAAERELAKAAPKREWLDRFDVKVGESPLKYGWEGGNIADKKLDFQYIWQEGNVFMRSRWLPGTEANALKKNIQWDAKEFPILRWRWRIQKFPVGAKVLEGRKSDAAAQVYLLWKGFPTYYVVKYFWATDDPVGTLLEQGTPFIGKLRGLVIRSGGKPGEWQTESRNVLADFEKYFGGDPPGKVKGLAILSDADETKSQSEADYDDFEILSPSKNASK